MSLSRRALSAFFGRTSNQQTATKGVSFAEQNTSLGPGAQQTRQTQSKGVEKASSATSGGSVLTQAKATVQKRRQQIYQAQKRHRNRKADYLQTLEAEVTRLQHLDAEVTSQRNELARQNHAMREILASRSLDRDLDTMGLQAGHGLLNEESQYGGASVTIRFDSLMQAERVFVDVAQPHTHVIAPAQDPEFEHAKTDSWTAMDFILALEWPCRHHVKHAGINADAQIPAACEVVGVHGHALTATSAVLACAQNELGHHDICSPADIDPGFRQKWQMPYAEIEKLIALSEKLELDDEQLTPAQAYAAVRQVIPRGYLLLPVLEKPKEPLGRLVQCLGLGTVLSAEEFWKHLESVMESVGMEMA